MKRWDIDDARDGIAFRMFLSGDLLGDVELASKGPASEKSVWFMGSHLAFVGTSWAGFDNPIDLWQEDVAPQGAGVRCAVSHSILRGKHCIALSGDAEEPSPDEGGAFRLKIKAKTATGFWIEGEGFMTPEIMETVGWFLMEVAASAQASKLGPGDLDIVRAVANLIDSAEHVAEDLGFSKVVDDV
jgi:hypothetical protein